MLLESALIQLRQIAPYWAVGLAAGSLVSVYLSDNIARKMSGLTSGRLWIFPVCAASALGIASPLCMFGTVPVIAALGKKGVQQHLLAAFMVSSVLLNPNLFIVSFALGTDLAIIRLVCCLLCGILAGTLVHLFFRKKELFSFHRFAMPDEKKKKRFYSDIIKAFRVTLPYLLIGVAITALCDRYVPAEWISGMFGQKRGLGVLFATTLSVPLYACGGGVIPLINAWMRAGMGAGDALAFMLAGPATKINNLSAVKTIFGIKNFCIYLAFCLSFAILAGWMAGYIMSLATG